MTLAGGAGGGRAAPLPAEPGFPKPGIPVPCGILDPGALGILDPDPGGRFAPYPVGILDPVTGMPDPTGILEPDPACGLYPGPAGILDPDPSALDPERGAGLELELMLVCLKEIPLFDLIEQSINQSINCFFDAGPQHHMAQKSGFNTMIHFSIGCLKFGLPVQSSNIYLSI